MDPAPISPASSTVALIRRHRSGDPQALNELFERYYERVYRLVRIELHGHPIPGREIADVVQDVFLRVVGGLEGYEERADARWISWVATMARHEISNRRREAGAHKRGGRVPVVPLQTDSGSWRRVDAQVSGIVTRVIRSGERDKVDACVPRLREDHRRVVLLRDYEGHDWSMIALEMRRSAPACQQLHARARVELLRLLRQR